MSELAHLVHSVHPHKIVPRKSNSLIPFYQNPEWVTCEIMHKELFLRRFRFFPIPLHIPDLARGLLADHNHPTTPALPSTEWIFTLFIYISHGSKFMVRNCKKSLSYGRKILQLSLKSTVSLEQRPQITILCNLFAGSYRTMCRIGTVGRSTECNYR